MALAGHKSPAAALWVGLARTDAMPPTHQLGGAMGILVWALRATTPHPPGGFQPAHGSELNYVIRPRLDMSCLVPMVP